jgi:hypothetical protein
MLAFSIVETDDAIKVLRQRHLHPGAVRRLQQARGLAMAASRIPVAAVRNVLVRRALVHQHAARADLVR